MLPVLVNIHLHTLIHLASLFPGPLGLILVVELRHFICLIIADGTLLYMKKIIKLSSTADW